MLSSPQMSFLTVNMVNNLDAHLNILEFDTFCWTCIVISNSETCSEALSSLITLYVNSLFLCASVRLRDRLVKIITDYRTETSLRHGCNDILKVLCAPHHSLSFIFLFYLIKHWNAWHFVVIVTQADCVNLLVKYYKEARHGIYLSNEEEEARAKRNDSSASQAIEKSSMRTTEVKSKTRGGGRCCMCFDPFSIQDVSVIAFFCCHAYHMTCLMDSTSNVSGKKGSEATSREPLLEYEYDNGDVEDDEDDDEDTQSSSRRVRCILCTTASS